MLKIAFDVGGVLSKYPAVFRKLIDAMHDRVDVHIISDMHPKEKIMNMLNLNGLRLPTCNIHSADYQRHGENCKKLLCEELGIDILVDDFIGYVAEGNFIRLLTMPNPYKPYYDPEWKTDGSEGNFGRSKCAKI